LTSGAIIDELATTNHINHPKENLARAKGISSMIAILYVEVAPDFSSAVEQLQSVSLGNCLQLVYAIGPNEIIIRLECNNNDTESMNRAISDFAGVEGVTLITTCLVKQS
jgi:hypothetical protein